MQTSERLLAIIHDRGQRGLPLEDVYRLLYNSALYLKAYGKIAANSGAMTKGTTTETVDGMSQEKIAGIIELLRYERYRWTPVRRVNIPKKNNPDKTRPLGIPTWSDKLLQEVIRQILEAYYEPQFDDHSHGFRPNRGCGTAISEIYHTWKGTTWFIEGDIKGCFDNIDHAVLLAIIAEKVHDNRFLRLLDALLKAGSLEDWRYNKTLSGTPQGGIVSPLLANIYLDRLDQFVTGTLIPQHTRGDKRKTSQEYHRQVSLAYKRRKEGRHEEAAALKKEYQRIPSVDPNDPDYRRLRYLRYADDFLLGFTGPHVEAETIRADIQTFLRETLKLTLSEEKTLITHGRTDKARFLGYAIATTAKDSHRIQGRRYINGIITLEIPQEVLSQKGDRYLAHGKPIHRVELLNDEAFTIIERYQGEYRGLVNYYRAAHNLSQLNKLKWTMEQSLTKTLAHKLKTSVKEVHRRYHTSIVNDNGRTYKGLQVVIERPGKKPLTATWGGISLARKVTKNLPDDPYQLYWKRTELVQRLLAETCELCGSTDRVQVHHIRKLADLKKHGRTPPSWVTTMVERQRKTMVVCRSCHLDIHAGRPIPTVKESTGEPCDAKVSSTVRRGADGKVPA